MRRIAIHVAGEDPGTTDDLIHFILDCGLATDGVTQEVQQLLGAATRAAPSDLVDRLVERVGSESDDERDLYRAFSAWSGSNATMWTTPA